MARPEHMGQAEFRSIVLQSLPNAMFCITCLPAGEPIIRKTSAHALGHLPAPYGDDDAPRHQPAPIVPQSKTGVSRWQHDLWHRIIRAAYSDAPNRVCLDYHPALSQPCTSRYGATSPHLLKWVDRWNAGKPYSEQIKPFGFLTSFTAKSGPLAGGGLAQLVDPTRNERPCKTDIPRPIAPFERNPKLAVQQAFDRNTGEPVEAYKLNTYSEALAQYHLSTEDKFENADFADSGETRRRRIVVKSVGLI